jgi:hypothetical protein
MYCDVMAGHNICNAIQGHLLNQQRPLYLQPKDTDGNYLWMQNNRSFKPRSGGSGGPRGVKRKAKDEGLGRGQIKKAAKA